MISHPAKTKSMLLTTGQKHQLRPLHLNLSLKASHIEQVHELRHLGVIIGDEFSWRPHITGTYKTVSKILYLLPQLRHFVDTPKRKLFYHVHISAHLTYAPTVWDGCSDILFNKLNFLHIRAAKLTISDSSLTTGTKLQYSGLLTLKEKFMFNKAVLAFKTYRNLAPPYSQLCSNLEYTFLKLASRFQAHPCAILSQLSQSHAIHLPALKHSSINGSEAVCCKYPPPPPLKIYF